MEANPIKVTAPFSGNESSKALHGIENGAFFVGG